MDERSAQITKLEHVDGAPHEAEGQAGGEDLEGVHRALGEHEAEARRLPRDRALEDPHLPAPTPQRRGEARDPAAK